MRARRIVLFLATLVASIVIAAHSRAEDSANDCPTGVIADKVRRILGQPAAVENKPGANGAIGAEYVAKSEPDGYTLFFTTVGAVAINPTLRSDLPYDPLKDFVPVGKAAVNSTI